MFVADAPINNMQMRSDARVWSAVLQATEDVGCDEAKAVRVLLHLMLLSAGRPTNRGRLRCYFKLWRHLALPFRRKLPLAATGNPLFAFVFDTASNVNNLVPVLQAARTNWPGMGVLTGDRVTASSVCFDEGGNRIGVTDLMAATTLKERFHALTEAARLYRLLLAGFIVGAVS